MGYVYADALVKGAKGEKRLEIFVDTSSTFDILPFPLCEEIGAYRTGLKERVELANGKLKDFEIALVAIRIFDRETWAKALLSDAKEIAIGALTLEALGLEVDPISGEVRKSRTWKARAPSSFHR